MIAGMKRCILVLLIVFFSMGNTAFAASSNSKTPSSVMGTPGIEWVNTTLVDINLSFDNSKAICGACVIGKSGTSRITGMVVLARKNSNGSYTTVKRWSDLEVFNNKLFFDKIYYVSTGYTYRLTITVTVYRNGISETVTGYNEAYAS